MTHRNLAALTLCAAFALSGCKHAQSSKSARTDAAKPGSSDKAAPAPNKANADGKKANDKAGAKAEPKKPAKPLLPKGVDRKDLDDSEVKVLAQIIDDQFDPCGKPRSFRQSLDAGDCALAFRLTRFITHKLQQGYGKRKIVKLLLREIERVNTIVELDLDGAPRLGPDKAKVKVVIFSDFECPFCRKSAKPLKKLQSHYGFALYYKHYPLKASHPHAEGAAMAAWAAQQQGKFWPMHDALFENAPALKWEEVQKYAKAIGLDMKKFVKQALSKDAKAAVQRDYNQGADADVDGTPTFFVNGRRAETLRQLQNTVREQMSLTGTKNLPDTVEVSDFGGPGEEKKAADPAADQKAAKPAAAGAAKKPAAEKK